MSIKSSGGNVSLELSGDLIDNLDQIATDAERRIIRSMQDAVDEVMVEAREGWPYKTGRTYKSWRTVVRLIDGGTKVQAYVTNDATSPRDGARYPFIVGFSSVLKWKTLHRENVEGSVTRSGKPVQDYGRIWPKLVNRPLKKRARKLVKELEADLVAAAEG